MNLLRRSIARELQLSSSSSFSSSRKCLLLLLQQQELLRNPIAVVQQHSSLYSTTTSSSNTRSSVSKNQKEERYTAGKNPKPQQEMVQNQTPEPQPQREIEMGMEMGRGIEEREQASKADWPRPSEIPWQAKVANSVNLIGHVQIPVQFEASPDGKYWAGTIISQKDGNSSDSPPFWIPIIFEGDLAHIAACHLKAKDCVYIAGQLSADPPPFTLSEGQANVQVMVRSINFVRGSSHMKKTVTPENLHLDTSVAGSVKDEVFVNQTWNDLFAKPHDWWDIRLKKGNSVTAAFEKKDNGQLLWINDSTPEWIRDKLECLTFDSKIVEKSLKNVNEIKDDEDPALDPWRDLVRNPQKWWDSCEQKLNGLLKPNYPDFKHKDGGLALWLNRAPEWVPSQLKGLEFDARLPNVKQAKESKGDDSWKNLVENPDKWWDNRTNKVNERAPDFKHKVTREALWLSDSPPWVSSMLPPLRSEKHTATISMRGKPLSETM